MRNRVLAALAILVLSVTMTTALAAARQTNAAQSSSVTAVRFGRLWDRSKVKLQPDARPSSRDEAQ